ncbi:MAG: hypothetical protein HKM93_13060 [Desulfobacteraceae bacterium]|nr:hypothetical protein [Desulfobacteraceae bacterium]
MTTFPRSPKLLKGGIVLIDPDTSVVKRIIALQYNPDTLTRTLKGKTMGEDSDRSQALRLKGPPDETYKLDAEIDAADQLEFPDQNEEIKKNGITPILSALEIIVYPESSQLLANNSLAASGTLEIAPTESPLMLFVWSKNRVLPVRLTDFSITEEAFDPNLNPIRAKVSLGMQVMTVNDLGFDHKGGGIYMAYHQQKEQLAAKFKTGELSTLGIGEIP